MSLRALAFRIAARFAAALGATLGALLLAAAAPAGAHEFKLDLAMSSFVRIEPTQAHLVEHARIEKMTLSKAIRKLEDAGLLQRDPSPHDSRAVHVRFTAKGRRLVARAVVAVEDADDAFFGCLPATQLAQYKAVARALVAGNGVSAAGPA